MRKHTIEEMKEIARERGGECLSNQYINSKIKLKWRCKEGHEWETAPNNVKQGHWCPVCGVVKQHDKLRLGIKQMKEIAEEKWGECLSDEYINNKTNLLWRCKEGHEWEATPDNIKHGKWCPRCAHEKCGIEQRLTIEEMRNIAKEKGGECLSDEYINSHTKLIWRCKEGHEWEAIPGSIVRGSWCPYCANNRRLTIEDMRKIAQERGGECLSKKYVNSQSKLIWRCKEGHEWEAVPGSVMHATWCPYCTGHGPLTIEELKQIAIDRGGQCLSERYIDNKTKLHWRCKKGHEWDAVPSSVKSGRWCPVCGGNKKLTMKDIEETAHSLGGECLSQEYANALSPLKWRCGEGHEWEATANNVRRGHWCPYCAGQGPLTIEEMKELAKERSGECLSKVIINSKTKLIWRCKEGHEWEAIPESVKRGTWCPICSIRIQHEQQRLTIEEMHEIAKRRGGECLSSRYIDSKTKLKWRCKEGHEWEAVPSSVKLGTWCPHCSGRIQTIDHMKRIATERGGKCLSEVYINSQTKLKWRCKEGHEWEAKPNNIIQGRWCPICSRGISERICRKMFEEIFNNKFPSKKPKWLIDPSIKGRMELDGYCKELKLAFEYQGEQHYNEKKQFYHRKTPYEYQQMRDIIKKEKCVEYGVTLIEIPYHILFENLLDYIVDICQKNGIDIPSLSLNVFDYKSLEGVYDLDRIEELNKIARKRGGKCLSEVYINSQTKLKWRCKEGHEWETAPNNVKQGHWCPVCGVVKQHDKLRLGIKQMKEIAEERWGECLSDEYINNKTNLLWRCKEGHEWEATPDNIKHGQWCPYCGHKVKLTIEEMNQIAKEKGGECLSDEYFGIHIKLKWRCEKGHIWKASPASVKHLKSWCPYCWNERRNRKKSNTLDDY